MAAIASVAALVAAIVVSMTTRVNVGLVAMALAWIVGRYVAGLTPGALAGGFPASLFLALAGVTLLFATADVNGTLERLAHRAAALARGSARALPLVFFGIACLVSAAGPGAVSSVALVAPLAMAAAARRGISPFLMSLMVANGANAGNLSPVSAVGVIANSRIAAAGLGDHWVTVMLANLIASLLVAVVAFVVLRGHRLPRGAAAGAPLAGPASAPLTAAQRLTAVVIAAWIAAVLAFGLSLGEIGFSAIGGAVLIVTFRAADESRAIARTPWGVILMVCGVTTLVAVVEATGGMGLFTAALARLASPATVNGVVAFLTGVISLYSSTSGVVLPAFLPTVPGIVEQLGGGDPIAIALSINVGSSLVDVSPLSTLGALCLATVADPQAARALFRQLLLWGVAMTIAGALVCQAFAGILAGI
jgi:Na+/H+ antiporter NhaD/arsenite permease-like protein